MTRTSRSLRSEAGSGLTPTALSALASIERNGPLTPARLAEVEGVKRPTVTRIIAHLLEAEMIERLPDAEDRRSFSLSVSPEGRAYLGELRSRKSAYLARELEGLSDQELLILSQAADILGRLNDERCGMDSR